MDLTFLKILVVTFLSLLLLPVLLFSFSNSIAISLFITPCSLLTKMFVYITRQQQNFYSLSSVCLHLDLSFSHIHHFVTSTYQHHKDYIESPSLYISAQIFFIIIFHSNYISPCSSPGGGHSLQSLQSLSSPIFIKPSKDVLSHNHMNHHIHLLLHLLHHYHLLLLLFLLMLHLLFIFLVLLLILLHYLLLFLQLHHQEKETI